MPRLAPVTRYVAIKCATTKLILDHNNAMFKAVHLNAIAAFVRGALVALLLKQLNRVPFHNLFAPYHHSSASKVCLPLLLIFRQGYKNNHFAKLNKPALKAALIGIVTIHALAIFFNVENWIDL